MSVFKNFLSLENLERENSRTFKDFQRPARALGGGVENAGPDIAVPDNDGSNCKT